MADQTFGKVEIKKLPDSGAEITLVTPFEMLAPYKVKALAHLKEEAMLPGFRKGKVPEKLILEKHGEMGILEDAAELFIKDAYFHILEKENLMVIGEPRVSVKKLAPGNPVEFVISVSLFPEFDLPDYKKIAKEVLKSEETVVVTDEDVSKVIDEIRAIRAETKEGGKILPELTDEFVKQVGPFETVDEFKAKVRENVLKEKEYRAKEKRRLALIGKIIEHTEIPVPTILIESELIRMFAQFTDDAKRMGTNAPEYLKKINKTENELKEGWRGDAKTRVKFELILEKVATAENITANAEEVEKEVSHITEHYSGSDPKRVRSYVEHQLRNEAVFQFLEKN